MSARLNWQRYAGYWALGIAATAAVLLVCLCFGNDAWHHASVTFSWPGAESLPFRLRRVGAAALVGAALAASGVVLQGLLRNPLAEPYVLGISSGSSVGVMLWLVLGWNIAAAGGVASVMPAWIQYGQTAPALAGALAACAIVFFISRAVSPSGTDPLTLLLVGVVLSAFCGAVVMLLNAIAPYGIQTNVMNMLVGYLPDQMDTSEIAAATAVFLAGWIVAIFSAGAMNIASLSDAEAASLGVRLSRLRTVCFICASVMTAAAIALARSIGFVGLICPHICRLIFGPDHRQLIVTTPFCGAIFLMLADAAVHFLLAIFPGGVPIGVVTALIGAPCFLFLLARKGPVAGE